MSAPTGVTGWVQIDALTNTNGATRVWRKVATATDAGAQVRIVLSTAARRRTSPSSPIEGLRPLRRWPRSAARLITTNSANRTTPIANVGVSSVVVSYWMHRDSTTTALTPPAGVTVRATGTQTGSSHVTVLTADSGSSVPVGPYGGLTARAAASSTLGTAWTIVLAPA